MRSAYVLKGATELPLPTVAASIAAMQILLGSPEKIQTLQKNALYFKKGLRILGFKLDLNPSGMASFTLSSEKELKELYDHLKQHHILPYFVPSMSYTSVPPTGLIKFALTSNHSIEQFDRVLKVIQLWLDKQSK